ncbi:FAD-dependent oxidoreductase [Nakamurella flavida]|uniref:FAD-dependent oxidoreductase n=1 Tax=Nakamurella flavida TaxID=363630 RepID=A0A938YLW5_9ACTN|nr:FAD-dependent oxidoreductase [Nakamurella flavida]MBM9475797.1 FAD-dependent oxidoreductase [Nakamurella flavida]MDP9777921.1 2-polyprenyl-6-methoxyphenol hydroxylase-like FAD-dependent oxidoreductase [Nakamurella flavida]
MTVILERDCVIAGGGPAGMVLGYLLARSGLRVSVLEKHADFFRDFRGDTVHPSTVTVLRELGLRDRFLQLPVNRLRTLDLVVDDHRLRLVDFSTLPAPETFLVLAPQWDFLNFLGAEGAAFEGFDLRMNTDATGLIIEGDVVRGLRATGPDGDLEIRATLTVAADGRASTLRDAAGLVPEELGVPIDVLWFGLPKPTDPPPPTIAYASPRGMVITIDRGDRYQSGMVVKKGGLDALKQEGLPALRKHISDSATVLATVVEALTDWDQIKLLSVQINRLEKWHRPGFIAIGDAAHAMSPVFGVGVNYAVQDAVALSNAIAGDLAAGTAPEATLAAVQARRMGPVRKMQRVQRFAHGRLARATAGQHLAPRWAIGLLRASLPVTRRFLTRFIGLGFLPEHVDRPVR